MRYYISSSFNCYGISNSYVNNFREIIYSLIGISNGAIQGQGYLQSMQKTFFPESSSSDYIFMVISEEWGIIGALFTILILVGISTICLVIGSKAVTRFGMLYSYGFAFLILIQTFINILS